MRRNGGRRRLLAALVVGSIVVAAAALVPGAGPIAGRLLGASGSAARTGPVGTSAVQAAATVQHPQGLDPSGSVPACPPLMFFGIRGSGESATQYGGYGQTIQSMKNYLQGLVPGMESESISYPAIAVLAWDNLYKIDYENSVSNGVATAMTDYVKFELTCPQTPIVLAGYSQGVDVAYQVASLLPEAARSHVIIVGFGDPHFNPGQSWADAGNYYKAFYGILVTVWDEQPHMWPDSYAPHLRSWCLHGDDICNATGLRVATCLVSCTHETGYISSGYTRDAASWAYDEWKKLPAPSLSTSPTPTPSPTPTATPTTGTSPWTAAQPPLPGDADSTSNSAINDVSCPSATSCLATGYYTDTSGVQQGMLLTWSDGAWTAAGKAPYANNLSCVTASLCIAVDGPDIETWSSGTWTTTSAPAPADNGSYPIDLESVSCVSASFCVAAGTYTDTSGNADGLLETLSDGTWTVEQAPLPADAAANPDVFFRSGPDTNLVSCPSVSFCLAAGTYTDTSGSSEGLLETLSDGTWTATKAPLPADAAANPGAAILGVSCPTASFCLATADYNASDSASESLLETWSGGSWSLTTVQTPANVVGPVACASTSACVITLIGGSEVLTSSGGSWTATQLPAPPYGVLWDISNLACASASHCIAVGDSSDATNEHWQAVMATGPG
jgi:Cutinase